jgi:hypothetical protein
MNKDSTETSQDVEPDKASKLKSKKFLSSSGYKKLFTGRRGLIAVFVIVLILLVAGIFTVYLVNQSNKVTPKDNVKIEKLLNSFNCSPSAMNSQASYRPNRKSLASSIMLLNYRYSCDVKNNQDAQAIVTMKQEKTYCTWAKNTACANDMQIFITNLSKDVKSNSSGSDNSQ